MNECLWLAMAVLDFALVLLLYRLHGRLGLLIWVPIATILANVQVLKVVELFGVSATLGNVAYGSIFLATDILSENHGKRAARSAVGIGFISMLSMLAIMTLALQFVPAEGDFAHEHLQVLFAFMPRVVAASLLAYVVSQYHDVWSYQVWRRLLPATRYLWVRNNFSTLVSQAIDTLIFTTVAFAGVFEREVFWSIVLTTYVLKAVVAMMDTPCIYIAKYLFDRGKIPGSEADDVLPVGAAAELSRAGRRRFRRS
jgi:uncharacterized integral membrane protein (TIGR00697 family)